MVVQSATFLGNEFIPTQGWKKHRHNTKSVYTCQYRTKQQFSERLGFCNKR